MQRALDYTRLTAFPIFQTPRSPGNRFRQRGSLWRCRSQPVAPPPRSRTRHGGLDRRRRRRRARRVVLQRRGRVRAAPYRVTPGREQRRPARGVGPTHRCDKRARCPRALWRSRARTRASPIFWSCSLSASSSHATSAASRQWSAASSLQRLPSSCARLGWWARRPWNRAAASYGTGAPSNARMAGPPSGSPCSPTGGSAPPIPRGGGCRCCRRTASRGGR